VKKDLLQVRMSQATTRFGDHAPMAAVCCNVCRTCTTTNLIAFGFAAVAGALYAVGRFGRRLVGRA
jgi:hypothetical protein